MRLRYRGVTVASERGLQLGQGGCYGRIGAGTAQVAAGTVIVVIIDGAEYARSGCGQVGYSQAAGRIAGCLRIGQDVVPQADDTGSGHIR